MKNEPSTAAQLDRVQAQLIKIVQASGDLTIEIEQRSAKIQDLADQETELRHELEFLRARLLRASARG